MSDFKTGDKVLWLHCPPGGYGYVIPVAGVVFKAGKRIGIEVLTERGQIARRYVTADNLRLRDNPEWIDGMSRVRADHD